MFPQKITYYQAYCNMPLMEMCQTISPKIAFLTGNTKTNLTMDVLLLKEWVVGERKENQYVQPDSMTRGIGLNSKVQEHMRFVVER